MATVEREAPPLAAGDRMARDEFLRRWELHPEIKRAELIGGVVYMPSPLSFRHGSAEDDIGLWLATYRVNTPGTDSLANATTLLQDDSPQPDRQLLILPERGGATSVEDKYVSGPAEFIVEVCLSSVSYDLHQKFDLYEEAGVREYLAFLVHEREIRWHILLNGRFQLLPPDADGIWRSRIFPGLWLDGQALLGRDMQQVLKALQEGLVSPEHQVFVEQLAKKRPTQE